MHLERGGWQICLLPRERQRVLGEVPEARGRRGQPSARRTAQPETRRAARLVSRLRSPPPLLRVQLGAFGYRRDGKHRSRQGLTQTHLAPQMLPAADGVQRGERHDR